MTSEHDRLLAEGPRVAPEPPTAAGDTFPTPAAAPVAAIDGEATARSTQVVPERPAGRSRGAGSLRMRRSGRHLLPFLFAAVLAARAFGSGRTGAVAFGLFFAAVIAFFLLRKARQL